MLNKNGVKLISTDRNSAIDHYSKKEIFLKDDERIIGLKSRRLGNNLSRHYDFQFVIGR